MRPSSVVAPARCSHLQRDARGYPVLASIPQSPSGVDFGSLSETRKLVVATFDLCAVCGNPFGDELRWQVTFDEDLDHVSVVFAEAPVHEVCGLYAAQVCPFVSSPHARFGDNRRKGQRRGSVVRLAGFAMTLRVEGVYHAAQDGSVLMFEMGDLQRVHTLRNAQDAKEVYAAALAKEQPVQLDPQEKALVELLTRASEQDHHGDFLGGAAWLVGAAFCPEVRRVKGMVDCYADPEFYDANAVRLLIGSEVAAFRSGDPHITAALAWLGTRTTLPTALAQWRSAGRRLVRARAQTAPARQAKSKRRQATASRKANRRAKR